MKSDEISTLNKDPTKKINLELKKILTKTSLLEHPKTLIEMNPNPPQIQGYVKIHKADEKTPIKKVPVRPVVPTCQAPTYKTEKFLSSFFKKHVKWKSKYSIKNSIELANLLSNIDLPRNAKLISLDIDSMYTNVNRQTAFHSCHEVLKSHSNLSEAERKQYIDLAKFTTENNYFQFQDKFYQLNRGLAMGSPLSPLMSEIFMSKFDQLICENEKWTKSIFFYRRYVDDIFLIWRGTDRELSKFVNQINKLEKNLRFKVERGGDRLDFMDLTLIITDNKIKIKVYRKKTYTDSIIPYNSHHSWGHKMAGFHCMIYRLLNLPLEKKEYNEELNTIITIAINNGYKKEDIMRILRKQRSRQEAKVLFNNNIPKNNKWIAIPFCQGISEQTKKIIRKEHKTTNVTYHNNQNLGRQLINTKKTHTDKLNTSGIYKVSCKCGKYYIGQTGRTINTRTNEHFANARLKKSGHSSLSDHLIEQNHEYKKCQIEVIHTCKKGKKMNLLEQMEIERAKTSGNILNTQIESTVTPLIMPRSLAPWTRAEEEKSSNQ